MTPIDLAKQMQKEVLQIEEASPSSEKKVCLSLAKEIQTALSDESFEKIPALTEKLKNSAKQIQAVGNNRFLEITQISQSILETLSPTEKALSQEEHKAIDSICKKLSFPIENAIATIFKEKETWKNSLLGKQVTFEDNKSKVF